MLNPPDMPRQSRAAVSDIGADEFIEALMEHAIDAISVADGPSGRLVVVSDSYCALTGYAREELIGQTPDELGLLSDKSARGRGIRRAAEGIREWHELQLRRKDGASREVETSIQLLAGGALILAISRDITARCAAAAELELRGQLLDVAHDAVVVREPVQSRITFWNREAENIYGYTREEAIGQVIHELLSTAFPQSQQAVEAVLARGGQWDGVLHHTRKDGKVIVVSSRQAVRRDADGRATAIIELNSDITERERAETEFRQLLESTPDAIVGVGRDGRIVLVNAQTEQLFGYRRGQLIGQLVETLVPQRFRGVHPGHRSGFFAAPSSRTMGAGLDLYGLRRDGSEFPAQISLSSMETADGPLATAAIRDDTARRLGEIVATSDDAIITKDLSGIITSWNAGARRLYGYSAAEVHGKSISLLAPEDRDDELRSLLARVAQGESTNDFETVRVRKDGSRVDVSLTISAVRDPQGHVIAACTIARDISERKRAEEGLSHARADIDQFFALSVEMMGIADTQGRFVRVNAAFERTLGFTPQEIMARPFVDFIHPADRAAISERFNVPGRNIGVHEVETRCRCRDGSYRWLRWTRAANQDGTVFATGRDVTERRQMDQELRASREQALEASRLKSEFVANMSHEIRTPLNGVVCMSELLLDTDLRDEQREYAQVALTSAEALMAIINDILDFSKITAGKLDILRESYSLEAAVRDVCAMVGPRASAKGVELTVSIEDVPGAVIGDANRVGQVLVNLLGNAIKFTTRGEIVVRATVQEAIGGADRLRIEVSDTGIGIDPDKLPDLFESFSQADATTTRKYGGTGLGLSIAKQLVELMDGDIGVRSIPGAGSTFWFTLPCLRATMADVAGPPTLDLTGTRLLIVDDNPTNRGIVERQCAAWGVIPDGADGGPAALELLHRAVDAGRPYELAVIDIRPEMDGLELARAITATPRLRSTRLIMLGSALVEAAQARAAGIAASLVKPVGQAQLHDQLIASLDRGARPAESPRRLQPATDSTPSAPLVLVAEDNEINQFAATQILHKLGYEVEIATNGREAIEMTSHTDYTIVFMDCQMPEIDGYTATTTIRQREVGLRHTPIIAMTAHAMIGDRDKCIASGMDDYIVKPMRRTNVEEICGRLLTGFTVNPVPTRPSRLGA
jgi:two-component system sensor histidine kinase/response regulator